MNQVYTAVGLVDRDKLEIKDVISEEPNCRVFATEWYLDGAMVRRDVNVNVFSGLSFDGKQGEL
jgi:hypothetical protein